MDQKISRFFIKSDLKTDIFFFKLNPGWWSRPYEYPWAASFISPNDVSLDAACGISHPFKFYLADHSRETYALDKDERILDEAAIRKDIAADFGAETTLDKKYFQTTKYLRATLTKIPLGDKKIDKIYCLSVLEHINDWSGKFYFLNKLSWLKIIKSNELGRALKEFRRILKDDGLIILTFDYPVVNLNYLRKIMKKQELDFAAAVDFNLPADAISTNNHKLYCFRAVLKKI